MFEKREKRTKKNYFFAILSNFGWICMLLIFKQRFPFTYGQGKPHSCVKFMYVFFPQFRLFLTCHRCSRFPQFFSVSQGLGNMRSLSYLQSVSSFRVFCPWMMFENWRKVFSPCQCLAIYVYYRFQAMFFSYIGVRRGV